MVKTPSERHLKLKLRQLDTRLRLGYHRVTSHIFLNGNIPEITGNDILQNYLKELFYHPCQCDRETMKEAMERAALAAALGENEEISLPRQPMQLLAAPIHLLSLIEARTWLVKEYQNDYWNAGFAGNVNYKYDKENEESCYEHEMKRPYAWPEELVGCANVTVAIKALGANLHQIEKSNDCPTSTLLFFKELIKRRLESENLDPEDYYKKEEWEVLGKRRRTRRRKAMERQTLLQVRVALQ